MSDHLEHSATRPASGAAPPLRRSLLVMIGDDVVAHPLPIAGTVTVGRGAQCDVRVEHSSMSRSHLALVLAPDAMHVRDLGGANGVKLAGGKLPREATAEVAANEPIGAGDVVLVIQEVRAAPVAESRPEHRPSGAISADDAPVIVDPAMKRLYELAARVARGAIGILLVGETGAGKEILAEHVHRSSPRAAGPLVRVNCAALADTLIESELFGHVKGAFTGADKDRRGLLETADGGTVFLDEVGEISGAVQAKLLRVLEQRQVLPVGGSTPRPIDVRFVAATNRDLEAEVAAGAFRRDLYYRLAGAVLAIPPLRERPQEIALLARAFAPGFTVTEAALDALRAHSWPGNVRELRNVVERATLLVDGKAIDREHLGLAVRADVAPPAAATLPDQLASLERQRILDALEANGGNQTQTARALGIPLRTLIKRIEAYQLPRPRKR